MISNPVSRRMQHRSLLIFKLSSLLSLDGVVVTAEERQIAVSSYSEAQVGGEGGRDGGEATNEPSSLSRKKTFQS